MKFLNELLGLAVIIGPLWLILLPVCLWFVVKISKRIKLGATRIVGGRGSGLAIRLTRKTMTRNDFLMQGGTMKPIFPSSLLLRGWQSIVFILTLGVSLSACSSITWKEEVLLHDGNKIIVSRTHTYDPKGLREPFQPDPLKESTLTFTVPGTKQTVMWKSDYGRGYQDNLDLLMLDFFNGVPYIATTTGFCHAYNKWGRPNPPYVFFKYDGEWKRIPLTEFPTEFKQANVIISAYNDKKIKEAESSMGFVPASELNKLNKYSQKRYSTIIRTPLTSGPENIAASCGELVFYKGAWVGPGDSIGKRMMDQMSKQPKSANQTDSGKEGGR